MSSNVMKSWLLIISPKLCVKNIFHTKTEMIWLARHKQRYLCGIILPKWQQLKTCMNKIVVVWEQNKIFYTSSTLITLLFIQPARSVLNTGRKSGRNVQASLLKGFSVVSLVPSNNQNNSYSLLYTVDCFSNAIYWTT